MPTRTFLAMLLASSTLSGFAVAQTAPAPTAPAPTAPAPADATQTRTGLGDSQPTDIGHVRSGGIRADGLNLNDAGGGLIVEEDAPKSRSTVTRDFIDKQSPTSNPYQLLRMLPGVNQQSTDANGLNGGNITIRGLNSDQVGLTIEGAPVNDSGNYALYPQEYIDAENLQMVTLTHGSADLDSPHIEAVGGMVNLYMRDPEHKFGGLIDFSVGNNATYRTFVRVDTGDIPGMNLRAFLSYSHYQDNHWRGPGGDNRDNFEGKLVSEFGQGNRVSFSFLFNDAVNNFYRNPTLAQFQQAGIYGTNYNAVPASPTDSSYYQVQVNPFRNLILSAPSTFNLGHNLTYDVTPYFWYGYGNGGGTTTATNGVLYAGPGATNRFVINGGQTIAFYTPSITETYRPGIINKLTYTWENHKLIAGYWFEWAHHQQTGPFSPLSASDVPNNVWGDTGLLVLPNGQLMQKRSQLTITTNNVLFFGDTISLMNDHLFIDVGIKQAWVRRQGTNSILGTNPNVSLNDSQTLPTAAIRFKPNDANTIFASVATNFRTPQNYTLFDSFSTSTGAVTNTNNTNQKAETSVTWELGHRFQNSLIDTSVVAFYTSFQNRLVSTTTPDASGSLISSNINVGGQRSYGVDLEAGLHPIHHFRPYVSAEFMNSELTDNYRVGNDFLPTRGKQAVRTPQVQAAFGLDYDDGQFFGNFDAKYVGSQYATFMNDQKIPGYFTADMTIGYHLPEFGGLKAPKIQLNIFNMFNNKYLSGIAGPQTNAVATRGVNGTTIAAASAPTYYAAQPAAFLITLSSAF